MCPLAHRSSPSSTPSFFTCLPHGRVSNVDASCDRSSYRSWLHVPGCIFLGQYYAARKTLYFALRWLERGREGRGTCPTLKEDG
ncbi:unnamed protein product [Calypogeia fissa]